MWKAPAAIQRTWSVLTGPKRVITVEPSMMGSRSRCTPSPETSGPDVRPCCRRSCRSHRGRPRPTAPPAGCTCSTTSSKSISLLASSWVSRRRASFTETWRERRRPLGIAAEQLLEAIAHLVASHARHELEDRGVALLRLKLDLDHLLVKLVARQALGHRFARLRLRRSARGAAARRSALFTLAVAGSCDCRRATPWPWRAPWRMARTRRSRRPRPLCRQDIKDALLGGLRRALASPVATRSSCTMPTAVSIRSRTMDSTSRPT